MPLLVRTDHELECVLSQDEDVTPRTPDPEVAGVTVLRALALDECEAGPNATRFWLRPLSSLEMPEIRASMAKLWRPEHDDSDDLYRERAALSSSVVRKCVTRARVDGQEIKGGSEVMGLLDNLHLEGARVIGALFRLALEVSSRPAEFFRRVRPS